MRISPKYLLGGVLIGLILLGATLFSLPDGKLHLVFCDVGQGDAIYLRTAHGEDILVDGGPNDKVLACLGEHMPFYDRTIELVFLSHPQADYLTGLISVLERYSVKYFVSSGIGSETEGYQQLEKLLKSKKVVRKKEFTGGKVKIDNLVLTSLWPNEQVLGATTMTSDSNDISLILKLTYGQFSALLTGDAPLRSASYGGAGQEQRKIEVLKVPHHGSRTGLDADSLEKIRPRLAVISVGKNSYGHPAKETLEVLRDYDTKILRTDNDGEIEIISDGKSWWRKN